MRFESLQEAQTYLDNWEAQWADTRIHGTTKRQVATMFAEEKGSRLNLQSSGIPSGLRTGDGWCFTRAEAAIITFIRRVLMTTWNSVCSMPPLMVTEKSGSALPGAPPPASPTISQSAPHRSWKSKHKPCYATE
jgi:hypothetical protein